MIIERRSLRSKQPNVRVSVLQEDPSEGDGAPKFKIEWKCSTSGIKKRITKYSFSDLLHSFSKCEQKADNIFRINDVLFCNHWLSDFLCSGKLKPTVLENMSVTIDLQFLVRAALDDISLNPMTGMALK